MKTLMRIIICVAALTFYQGVIAERLYDLGEQICFLRNMPHRGIGCMFAATMLEYNDHWQRKYLSEWYIAVHEKRLHEATDREKDGEIVRLPVMEMAAVRLSLENPHNKEMKAVAKIMKQEYQK